MFPRLAVGSDPAFLRVHRIEDPMDPTTVCR